MQIRFHTLLPARLRGSATNIDRFFLDGKGGVGRGGRWIRGKLLILSDACELMQAHPESRFLQYRSLTNITCRLACDEFTLYCCT